LIQSKYNKENIKLKKESPEFMEKFEFAPEPSESIISDNLPVLPLRGAVVFPTIWLPLPVGRYIT